MALPTWRGRTQESCQQINFTPGRAGPGHMAVMATGCLTTFAAAAPAVSPLPFQCQCVKQRAMRNNLQNVIISLDFAQQQTEKKQLEKQSHGVDGGGRMGWSYPWDARARLWRWIKVKHTVKGRPDATTQASKWYRPIFSHSIHAEAVCSARLVYHHQGWCEAELTPYTQALLLLLSTCRTRIWQRLQLPLCHTHKQTERDWLYPSGCTSSREGVGRSTKSESLGSHCKWNYHTHTHAHTQRSFASLIQDRWDKPNDGLQLGIK